MRKRRLGQSNSDNNLAIEDGGIPAFNQPMPSEGEPESELEFKENILANRKVVKHETLGNRSSIE